MIEPSPMMHKARSLVADADPIANGKAIPIEPKEPDEMKKLPRLGKKFCGTTYHVIPASVTIDLKELACSSSFEIALYREKRPFSLSGSG
jgi:hypothetical protein